MNCVLLGVRIELKKNAVGRNRREYHQWYRHSASILALFLEQKNLFPYAVTFIKQEILEKNRRDIFKMP